MKVPCKYCNNPNEEDAKKCSACGAPLHQVSKLSKKDRENLSNYILGIEKMFESVKNYEDKSIFLFFFGCFLVWLGSTVAMIKFSDFTKGFIILVSVLLGGVLVVIWGAIIGIFEHRAYEKYYNKKIKKEIDEYLNVMNFQRHHFKVIGMEILDSKARLNKFLDDF